MKKLLKLALIVGAVAVVAKILVARESKWQGLTESEVRDKLESKLPKRVPEEKRAAFADKVVSKMQERGQLGAEEEPPVHAPTDGREAEKPDSGDAGAGEGSEDVTASV